MSFVTWFAVGLLATGSSFASGDVNAVQPVAFTNHADAGTASSSAQESDSPLLSVGTKAPDFQYQSYDALWQHLHNVLEHGDVLLVFGASDVDLRTLERERETLVQVGVLPLAVVEHNDRDVWASVRRLGLTYSLLADPKGAIGSQYGVFDASIGRSRSAWFVIDRKGKVRQNGGEMPTTGWAPMAATALGRALEGSTQNASKEGSPKH